MVNGIQTLSYVNYHQFYEIKRSYHSHLLLLEICFFDYSFFEKYVLCKNWLKKYGAEYHQTNR